MKASKTDDVRRMYDDTAEHYAEMMDGEIDLPVYADTFERLAERIAGRPGTLIDSSCGSGHMLARYRERYEPERRLLGIDLSPAMVALAAERLGAGADVRVGDMCDLAGVEPGSAAALLSFFAIHHLDPEAAGRALREWHRVLAPAGELLVAAWEGAGAVDYGEAADLVAFRYGREEIEGWAQAAGFAVSRCVVEPVMGIAMDAVYLEGVKA